MVLLSEPWVEKERLIFPLVRLPLEVVGGRQGSKSFFRNPVTWYGIGAAFLAAPAAGRLDQDPSHHLRRQRQEVRPVPPFDAVDLNQPQVRLVHQGRRTQCMIWSLLAHVASCKPVELAVQQWNQSLARGFVALTPGSEELGRLNVGIMRHDSFPRPMSPS